MRDSQQRPLQVAGRRLQVFCGLALLMTALFAACKKEDDNSPPPSGGIQFTSGDTVFTIPAAALTFARQNFSRDAQLLREFQLAVDPNRGGPVWQLPLNPWKQSGFDTRQQYMVTPYDNDVTTGDSALFYYEIGTFFSQFGYGWKDTFDAAGFEPDSAYTNYLWHDPTQTIWFDGQSPFFEQYRGMWTQGPM